MGRSHPAPDCIDVRFASSHGLGEDAELALEDYARALLGAREAELIPGASGLVAGVHVCGAAEQPGALAADLEDFARELVRRAERDRSRP